MVLTLRRSNAGEPLVSVVVPVYNEREVLETTHRELGAALDRLGEPVEILYVDDGSTDGTRDLLVELSQRDDRVRVVALSRNFGHEIATTVGLHQAEGRAVVVIDADLQDPPELIPALVARWREGYQVVYGVRQGRDGESLLKRVAAYLFYRLMARVADFPFPADAGDFRLVDRRVVDIYRRFQEEPRFFRGLVSWVGFRQTGLPFRRRPRAAGRSKYDYRRLVKLAFDTITAFSTFPAQLVLFLAAGCFGVSLVGAAVAVGTAAAGLVGAGPAFWLGLLILLVVNLQFGALAVLGQYIVRTHRHTQGRPLYIVEAVYRHGTQVSQQRSSQAV